MSSLVPEINSPISTPSPSPAASQERNDRGCLLRCPHCGESLPGAPSAASNAATATPTPAESRAVSSNSAPAPAKKGLLGLGFLGLGGRRRTARRHRRRGTRSHRRRTHHRK